MKIGIMTFWWSEDNYGQLLQCYALQKYLRDQGHDAYLIRYDPRNDYIKTKIYIKLLKALSPIRLSKYIRNKIRHHKSITEQKQNPRNFDSFRNTYIKQSEKLYTSYKQLKEDPPEADVYLVGSDQVWNFWDMPLDHVKNVLHAYFLDFGDARILRISYAASWGRELLNDDFINEIKPLLSRFDYVSVREKSGIELCSQCGVQNADWVPDPTLLLSKDIYRALYDQLTITTIKRKYLLLYLLGNVKVSSFSIIQEWAKSKYLDVIYITGNDRFDKSVKNYPSIPEWVNLIDNAEYVITNSFHCCVFSVIFHKRFISIPATGNIAGMNSRFESLWELINTTSRYYIENDLSLLDQSYEDIDRVKLNDAVVKFKNILSKTVSS